MRQAEEQAHQGHRGNFGLEPGGETFLDHGPKEKFLDQADLKEEPGKTKRQADGKLAHVELAAANRRRAGAGEILEKQDDGGENEHDEKMIARQRLEPGPLHPEVAPPISKD